MDLEDFSEGISKIFVGGIFEFREKEILQRILTEVLEECVTAFLTEC